MRSIIVALFTLVLAATIPSLARAGMGYSQPSTNTTSTNPPSVGFRDSDGFLHRPSPTPSPASQGAIVQQPYNLGQAIYNGTYKFNKAPATHAAEKVHRLGILQSGLPAAEKQRINPKELANRLNDREMNALEYYIRVRFGKFVTAAPSWAKQEPPIKVSNTH